MYVNKQLLDAAKEMLIDVRLSQNNMRHAAGRDAMWQGCAEAIQPRVDALQQAIAAAEQEQQAEPVAWKHDCAALLMNDVELWVRNCPHCGKPRSAQPPAVAVPDGLATALMQARYALRDFNNKQPGCGFDKLATACERAASIVAAAQKGGA